jgi:hypothetical protein
MRNPVWPVLAGGVALGVPDATVAQLSGAMGETKGPTTPENGDVEAEVDVGLARFGYLACVFRRCRYSIPVEVGSRFRSMSVR